MRYLDGGGMGCMTNGIKPDRHRRLFHHLTFYGFLLCFASTSSGTIMHYLFNCPVPYPWWTPPKVMGVPRDLGLVISAALVQARGQGTGFDIDPKRSARAGSIRVRPAASHVQAVRDATLVLSTVIARQTETAAKSVAPVTKQLVQGHVTKSGLDFIDGVAMDTVPRCGVGVPLLACGPRARWVAQRLIPAGFDIQDIGADFGAVAGIKLTRSIFIKGLEALFADMALMGAQIDQTDRVLSSIQTTFPSVDWRKISGYHLKRMVLHGARRGDEMRDCADMLAGAGLNAQLITAIAARHAVIGRDAPDYQGETVDDFTAAMTGQPS